MTIGDYTGKINTTTYDSPNLKRENGLYFIRFIESKFTCVNFFCNFLNSGLFKDLHMILSTKSYEKNKASPLTLCVIFSIFYHVLSHVERKNGVNVMILESLHAEPASLTGHSAIK